MDIYQAILLHTWTLSGSLSQELQRLGEQAISPAMRQVTLEQNRIIVERAKYQHQNGIQQIEQPDLEALVGRLNQAAGVNKGTSTHDSSEVISAKKEVVRASVAYFQGLFARAEQAGQKDFPSFEEAIRRLYASEVDYRAALQQVIAADEKDFEALVRMYEKEPTAVTFLRTVHQTEKNIAQRWIAIVFKRETV